MRIAINMTVGIICIIVSVFITSLGLYLLTGGDSTDRWTFGSYVMQSKEAGLYTSILGIIALGIGAIAIIVNYNRLKKK